MMNIRVTQIVIVGALVALLGCGKTQDAPSDSPVEITHEKSSLLEGDLCDYVVYSEESSYIRNSVITNNGHIGSGGYVEIGVTAQINGNVQSSGTVFLMDRSDINGDVLAGGAITKQNLVEIEGEEIPFTVVPTVTIPDRSVTPGTEDVNIWNGESRVLEPGSYDEVHAYGGATLTLMAGEYNLRNLIIEASSVHLRLDVTDGHIDLNVQDQLRFGNQMTLEMVGGTDPKLFCAYSNGSWVDVGTDIDFKGTITAPYGEIHVYSRFILHGRLFGKRVYVDSNSQLYGEGCDGICCVPGGPTPTDEVCDGIDEDCDGKTDEEYQEYGTECGVGACAATGTMICVNGAVQDTCVPGEPAADDSVCNGIDDDCDGETDEDYPEDPTECGIGACAATGNMVCVDGEEQNTCTPGEPAPDDSACNGIDDDCDGDTDEEYVSQSTSCGVGACASTGSTSCVDGAVQDSCQAGTPAADDTLCNGIDDDCDSATDEEYVSLSTTCGVGACASTGNTSCVDGLVQNSCQAGTPAADDSLCNGIDDDCDDATDEEYASLPTSCGIGACASTGSTSCVDGLVQDSCVVGTPAADDSLCNGIDDDCDNATDEEYAPIPISCGIGACSAEGTTVCIDGAEEESCTPGTPADDDESCNNVDDDCDGDTDEEYVPLPTSCGTGYCAADGLTYCEAGSVEDTCQAGQPLSTMDTTCDGVDDDCDDATDEEYVSLDTTCGIGACASTGSTSCVAGAVQDSCEAGTPAADDSLCNGIDDDCDEATDEEYVFLDTTCGIGACASTGNTSCVSGAVQDSCTPGTPAADDSLCNGIDDDCADGVDEDYVSETTSCGDGVCASTGATSCVSGGIVDSCAVGQPTGDDTDCNGIDENCNGTADEGYQGTPTTCGIGACFSTGELVCVNGAVEDTCVEGTPAPDDDTCDGIDDDCDGATDEDCLRPVVIVTQPQSVTVDHGAEYQLTVEATGYPLNYQWKRFDEDIPGATDATYIGTADYTDSGTVFTCSVSNSLGTVTTNQATLLVVDHTPPTLTVDGDDVRSTVEDIVTITGFASDEETGMGSVVILSDQFPEISGFGAVLGDDGGFSGEVPLALGENVLTVLATDKGLQQTTHIITVTLLLTDLPKITLISPVSGDIVPEDRVDVIGVVRSSLPPEQIRLRLGGELIFPTGAGGEYDFTFENIPLIPGSNTLVVTAETPVGSSTAQVTVLHRDEAEPVDETPPVLELQLPSNHLFTTRDDFYLSGSASAESGIASVTINGQGMSLVGNGGNLVSFDHMIRFSDLGTDEVTLEVAATANNDLTTAVTCTVTLDNSSPVIQVVGLQEAPAVNTVTATPFGISGTVVEAHLAGIEVHGPLTDQSLGVLPAGEDGWSFATDLALPRGEETPVTVEAWDVAGNRSTLELVMLRDVALDVEILSPGEGSEIVALDGTAELEILVRAPGLTDTDTVTATVSGAGAANLAANGDLARGTLSMGVDNAEHTVTVEVRSDTGTLLGSLSSRFTLMNAADIPLELLYQDPPNMSDGVETNSPIVYYFNRPIDPALLEVQVLETVHGKIYQVPEEGDLTNHGAFELVEVHRDREPVPGGLSHIPGDTMVAFYADRDLAYGGTVYSELIYNGEPLTRTVIEVRPLPTLVEGTLADRRLRPVEGITVLLPGLGKSTTTDREGNFRFGFGEPADEMIPPGRHKVVFNPAFDNPGYGTLERWLDVQAGQMVDMGASALPAIDKAEPFRHMASGDAGVLLGGGDVVLDLSDAEVVFPDGRTEGDVHFARLTRKELGYPTRDPFTVPFAYALQPAGIRVSGSPKIIFPIDPALVSQERLEAMRPYLLLMGLSPDTLELTPVGVVRIEPGSSRVVTVGELGIARLDYLAYVEVPAMYQSTLESYANGEIALDDVIGQLVAE